MEVNHAERAHALLSASGASRWMNCTASARYEDNFPDNSSPYAEEGTLAHELGEIIVKQHLNQITSEDFQQKLNEIEKSKYFCEEMFNYMMGYGNYIAKRLEDTLQINPTAFAEVEIRLDFSKWVPEGFGTGDCMIITDKTIEIIDLKYGKGYKVDAKNNPQMRLYALGVLSRYSLIYQFESVKTVVYQPRTSSEPSFEEISVVELLRWAENEVVPKAKEAFEGNGVFCPSESSCKFCRAKQVCGGRTEKNQEVLIKYYDPEKITELTLDTVGFILTQGADIKKWLSDLESLVIKSLSSGTPVDGWKLVEGRSNRTYKNQAEAKMKLLEAGIPEDDFIEESMISISKLEKKLGKEKVGELLEGLITKPKGKPSLVPDSDRRKAINTEVEIIEMFDDDFEE